MKSWEVIVEEDEFGDIILPLPAELIRENDWREGDELDFQITESSIIVINLSEKIRREGLPNE